MYIFIFFFNKGGSTLFYTTFSFNILEIVPYQYI